jgi:hypothetical protein
VPFPQTTNSQLLQLGDEGLRRVCGPARISVAKVSQDLARVSHVAMTRVRVLPDGGGQPVLQTGAEGEGEGGEEGAFVVGADGDYVLELTLACKSGAGTPIVSSRFHKQVGECRRQPGFGGADNLPLDTLFVRGNHVHTE